MNNPIVITRNYEISIKGRGQFGYVPDPDYSDCADACRDETLCESCKFFSEHHGIPSCCGNEYIERESN